jgi:hypothetical protein
MDRNGTQFRGGEELPELAGYRPVSPFVIGVCIASVLSLLALIHPLLWVIPVVTVVLAIIAIVRVSPADSDYSGRLAAMIALCFATLVGGYAPARVISSERTLYAIAREKSEQWIALLQQGRIQEAHQFTKSVDERYPGPESLATYYTVVPQSESRPPSEETMMEEMSSMSQPSTELKQFAEMEGVAKIIEIGEQSRPEHLQNIAITSSYGDLVVTQRFRIAGETSADSIEFTLRATRRQGKDLTSWKVGNVSEVK